MADHHAHYIDSLILTIRAERDKFDEPLFSTLLCLAIAISNLAHATKCPICQREADRKDEGG